MKPFVKIVACTIISFTLLALSCGSPQGSETPVINDYMSAENKLIGVWKYAELVDTDLDIPEEAREIGVWKYAELVDTDLDIPEEAREIGVDYYMVFTKKYRFVVGSRIPNRPILPESPTDSQLLAAWEPVLAMVFTYEIKENNIITRLVFAKDPNEKLGGEHIYPLKFDGDDLIWTYGANEGRNTVTQRYKRLE